MIELISLLVLFIGLSIASYYDLKTTEIPDNFAYVFLALGLTIFFVFNYLNNFRDIKNQLLVSVGLSLVGFLMYFFGQWGMGDAFLLAACSFMFFYNTHKPFLLYTQLDFFTNLIIVGAFYIPAYMLPSFLREKGAKKEFIRQLKENFSKSVLLLAILMSSYILISFYLFNSILIKPVVFSLAFSLLVIVLWFYLKACEKILVKKIPVKNLKVGDVLLESKRWDGLGEKELEKIKKSGRKFVYIKSGVAFAPVFLISLIITLLFGNLYRYVIEVFLFLL